MDNLGSRCAFDIDAHAVSAVEPGSFRVAADEIVVNDRRTK